MLILQSKRLLHEVVVKLFSLSVLQTCTSNPMTEELNTRTRSGLKAKLIITGKKEESNLVSVFHYTCSSLSAV